GGAGLERIVRRRPQPGLRAGPGGALLDPRIEQLLQCRRNRRQLLARGLGARRARRILGGWLRRIARGLLRRARLVVVVGHGRNMGRPTRRGKGGWCSDSEVRITWRHLWCELRNQRSTSKIYISSAAYGFEVPKRAGGEL